MTLENFFLSMSEERFTLGKLDLTIGEVELNHANPKHLQG